MSKINKNIMELAAEELAAEILAGAPDNIKAGIVEREVDLTALMKLAVDNSTQVSVHIGQIVDLLEDAVKGFEKISKSDPLPMEFQIMMVNDMVEKIRQELLMKTVERMCPNWQEMLGDIMAEKDQEEQSGMISFEDIMNAYSAGPYPPKIH